MTSTHHAYKVVIKRKRGSFLSQNITKDMEMEMLKRWEDERNQKDKSRRIKASLQKRMLKDVVNLKKMTESK